MIVTFGLAACARAPATTAANNAVVPPQSEAAHPTPTVQQAVDETLLPVMAYKSPTCGCCELWIEHMRAAGFRVEVTNTQDMGAMKAAAGVPVSKGSCHTAKVGDYYVEGHVPASDVKRLLAEKPDARGLIVPGMVLGSPGMEQGGVQQAYNVLLLAKDGSTTVYSHHGT
jgi:hypothetical protein